MKDFVISVRNMTKGNFGNEPKPTKFWGVPPNKKDTHPDQKIARTRWTDAVIAEAKTCESTLSGNPLGDILVYTHGFNNRPPDVLVRNRLLKKEDKKRRLITFRHQPVIRLPIKTTTVAAILIDRLTA